MSVLQEVEGLTVSAGERATVMALVRARLRRSAYEAIRSITCEFHEGVLTLRGRVPSYYLKQVAQELVRHTDRVSEVNNRVCVDPPVFPDGRLDHPSYGASRSPPPQEVRELSVSADR